MAKKELKNLIDAGKRFGREVLHRAPHFFIGGVTVLYPDFNTTVLDQLARDSQSAITVNYSVAHAAELHAPMAQSATVAKAAETRAAAPRPQDIPEVTQFLIQESAKFGVPDNIGYRVSNAWLGSDGWYYGAWQGAILQTNGRDTTQLWNVLDEMHTREMDNKLANGSLGVTIPPHEDFNDGAGKDTTKAFEIRTEHFSIPSEIDKVARKVRQSFEIGTPTAHAQVYLDANGKPVYEVARYQRIAYMHWLEGPDKGLVQRILVGDAAKAAEIVPREVWLEQPDMRGQLPSKENTNITKIDFSVGGKPYHLVGDNRNQIFQLDFNPGALDQLQKAVAADGLQYGFNTLKIITLNSKSELPKEVSPRSITSESYWPDINDLTKPRIPMADVTALGTSDGMEFYIIPNDNYRNATPEMIESASQGINWDLSAALAKNGYYFVESPFKGDSVHLALALSRPISIRAVSQ